MQNRLLEKVEYQHIETSLGRWKRFMYSHGDIYEEFESHARYFDLPLFHYTRGYCPETGKRTLAKGIIAVGRFAAGGLAIGQVSFGVIAIGQLAISPLVALGQAAVGLATIGQLSIALIFGLGQIATGMVAIGQIAFGKYVLAQIGFGQFVWDTRQVSPIAQEFFRSLLSH